MATYDNIKKIKIGDNVFNLAIPTKISELTNDSGFVTTDEKLKVTSISNSTEYTLVTMPSSGSMPKTTTGNLCGEFTIETDRSSYSELYVGKMCRGQIKFGNTTNSSIRYTTLKTSHTTDRTITLPDKTGTVALISDIPTVPTITLNGSSTTSPSFYAPTTAGTSGYVLKSNGSGAPTWVSAALTDTKNTAGSTNSTSKLYLIGATSQAANPQTYSNSKLTFDNGLYSTATSSNNQPPYTEIEQTTSFLHLYGQSNTGEEGYIYIDGTTIDIYSSDATISIDGENGVHIYNVVTPTNNTDAANKKYVDDALSSYSTATNWLNGSATGSVRTSRSIVEDSNYTMGQYAVAEGYITKASSIASHAEGYGTTASGLSSHAEGTGTTASASYSHAEGGSTTASGQYSHAGGLQTVAQRQSQTAIGEYNILDTSGTATTRGDYAFIIGNGTANNARSNALTVDWSGNLEIAGSLNDEALLSSATIAKWNAILGVA